MGPEVKDFRLNWLCLHLLGFFSRCLDANLIPYVITKKTVFKWQEPFWQIMKDIFDSYYKEKYIEKNILKSGYELQHIISDAATMKLIQWRKGGFGMVAHNYDADMLTDEMAQIHKSPGLITSNLVGKSSNGTILKQFEASHGTVTDLWEKHVKGEETSLNILGLMEALIGAMNYAEQLRGTSTDIQQFNSDNCFNLVAYPPQRNDDQLRTWFSISLDFETGEVSKNCGDSSKIYCKKGNSW